MKKRVLSLLYFLLVVEVIFASTVNDTNTSKYFKIQGASGAVLRSTVSPISTQSTAFIMGMPFDIEDDLVQYGVMQNGRTIANWSLVTNADFTIKIKADNLKSANNTGTEGVYCYLPYILKFTYNFGYFDSNGNSLSKSGEFTIDNESGIVKYTDPSTGSSVEKGLSADGYLSFQFLPSGIAFYGLSGSVDGDIYFMFTESSSDTIKNHGDTVPVGDYSADVTILLESV